MSIKKISILLTLLFGITFLCKSAVVLPTANHSASLSKRPLSEKDQLRVTQMRFYSSLSLKQYQKLRGEKLNFVEKQLFKQSKRRMKTMLKVYDYGEEPTIWQKMSWYLKGLLLGPIGVALAYIFLKDEERSLIKWAWLGFIGFVAVALFAILAFI